MNPKLVFWVPAALRTALILAGCALAGWIAGWLTGLVLALLCMIALVFVQLSYLYQLSNWMDDPQSAKLPDGWGEWTNIFSRLYRMRREDEKNQAELTEWLARFRQAMHLLPDGVAIMDDVLFLEWCNPAAEQHLGLSNERDKGMRVTNLVRNPDFMDYIILGRYEQPLTISFRERKLIVHIIPFENRRQILVTHDATETERIEEMRRDFIANASHELRTPLTVIVGFLEIAAQEGLDAATRAAHLKLMTEQGHRMQHLIEDMLTLSRLESVDYPMRPEPVDVHKLMEQVQRDAKALSAGKHEVTMSIEGPDVLGSYEELHSAFGNLASNAVRYTPAGGKIHLAWREFEGGIKFKVEDTGIGISPEHISRLTERFYRVDKSRSRETQGTGLGLAIVKHVLLRHGGTLQIKSEAGKGSSFIVCLPKTAIVQQQPELLLN
ncbi:MULTISPECIES: phosphate regulon sensor histidine kinase PhoR [unclassified Duganella]|uniref:phosphate regulon sensor histidine kinase PhoR n=1 Tax=unclassified Duganella TaxID=2636909 RepID=UPI00088F79FD|nr:MULTISPECIES: phosphate regulon sensor histidine kinase PhoR [unclassified Duganella]SDG38280.1 two-component system, OmpR family, phosphate regulon sensor histidine kinase PhoR [Duganella sp. OV458]SDJ65420.1 two-component system, OmpR family, phosphate regulon sensor histidine kinase PhoR [Duganella sp. OV510]